MAAWSPRLVKEKGGKLQFAWVRFRDFDDCISGTLGISGVLGAGDTVDDMRALAHRLLQACDAGIIDLADGRDPDAVTDEDDYEPECSGHDD
jgi:hypothetical protein